MYLSSVNLLNQTVCIIIARQIILSLSDAMVICVCLIECALTSCLLMLYYYVFLVPVYILPTHALLVLYTMY